MTLRTDIYSRCTGHAGTAALIGTRCYPDQLPENVTYPALSYALVSADNSTYRDHDGATDREVSRVQFNCYDDTGDDAAALADQLRSAWDGYSSVESRLKSGSSAQTIHREIVDVMIEHSV
jgi:hypothetical protein